MEHKCEYCGKSGHLILTAKCHPYAAMRVEMHDDMLFILCYECDREVTSFMLSEQYTA